MRTNIKFLAFLITGMINVSFASDQYELTLEGYPPKDCKVVVSGPFQNVKIDDTDVRDKENHECNLTFGQRFKIESTASEQELEQLKLEFLCGGEQDKSTLTFKKSEKYNHLYMDSERGENFFILINESKNYPDAFDEHLRHIYSYLRFAPIKKK